MNSRHLHVIEQACRLLLFALPLALVAYWLALPRADLARAWLAGAQPVFGFAERLLALTICAVPVTIAGRAVLQVQRCAARVRSGVPVSAMTARSVRDIAHALLMLSVLLAAVSVLVPLILTLGAPAGSRLISVSIDAGMLIALGTGFVLVLVGRMLDEAARVVEDHAMTV